MGAPTEGSVVINIYGKDDVTPVLDTVNTSLQKFRTESSALGSTAAASMSEVETATKGASQGFWDMRHAIGLVDNTMRGNLVYAVADVAREMQNVSFVMAAIPFVATGAAIFLVGEYVAKAVEYFSQMGEAAERVSGDFSDFNIAANNSLAGIDDKILAVDERIDDLNKNYLGALKDNLSLINSQSMSDLIGQFEKLDKAARQTFKDTSTGFLAELFSNEGSSAGASSAEKHLMRKLKTLSSEASLAYAKGDSKLGDALSRQEDDLVKRTFASEKRKLSLLQEERRKAIEASHYAASATAGTFITPFHVGSYIDKKSIEAQQQYVNQLRNMYAEILAEQRLVSAKIKEGTLSAHHHAKSHPHHGEESISKVLSDQEKQTQGALRKSLEAQTQMRDAHERQDLALARSNAQAELRILDSQYSGQLDKSSSYYDRKLAIQSAEIDSEEKALKAHMSEVRAAMKSIKSDSSDQLALSKELLAIQTQLAELSDQRKSDEAEIATEQAHQALRAKEQQARMEKALERQWKRQKLEATKHGEKIAEAFFDPLMSGNREFARSFQDSLNGILKSIEHAALTNMLNGIFGVKSNSTNYAFGPPGAAVTGHHAGLLSRLGGIFGLSHGIGGNMPRIPSAAGAISPASMPGLRMGNSPNIAVQLVNQGAPAQVKNTMAGKGQDPAQMVISVVLDDLHRGGSIAQGVMGIAAKAILA